MIEEKRYDERLLFLLRVAGEEWGPLGVARVAAELVKEPKRETPRHRLCLKADAARIAKGYAMDPAAVPVIVEAVLPTIKTVEQLEALPVGSWLISESIGAGGFCYAQVNPDGVDVYPKANDDEGLWTADSLLGTQGHFLVIWRPDEVQP